MWRRVLSQSPSSAPTDAASQQVTRKYLDGWKALGALLHSGGSLSGHERNCCFLNLGQPRFANASSAIGFDHDADSRGVVSIDWDNDGDLDIWTVNRTEPRVRYLENNIRNNNQFLKLRLVGTKCNRDAIGARVELHLRNNAKNEKVLMRSINAGSGFVSQQTKELHFGFSAQTEIDHLVVHWPGGQQQTFSDLDSNRTYVLVQDQKPKVFAHPPKRATTLPLAKKALAAASKRIVLPRAIPMPEIQYQSLDHQKRSIFEGSRPRLVTLWASWCPACKKELNSWSQKPKKDRSFDVLLLNLDHVEQPNPFSHTSEVKQALADIGVSFPAGIIDRNGFELFELTDRTLLIQQMGLPIPCSFLIDAQGRLAVVYKGEVSLSQVESDVRQWSTTAGDVRDPSVPFAGTWYSDPFPADLVAIPSQMVGLGRADDAFRYLMSHLKPQAHLPVGSWDQLGVTSGKAIGIFQQTASLLVRKKRIEDAILLYERAIEFEPQHWETHVILSSLLIQAKQYKRALVVNRTMSELKPRHPLPWTNTAWIRATAQDPKIRDVKKAVQIAEKICRATNNREPSALDVLAVAYLAAERKEKAIQAATQAVQAAKALGQADLVIRLQRRLDAIHQE